MQDISKHYNFTIDTKETKLLKKNLIFNYADDITLHIEVLEGGIAKDLTNCKVDLVVANQDNHVPIIHKFEDGGISILDNIVTIVCKNNYIDLVGANISQLIIRDEDQNITTQQFLYITNSTLISDEIANAQNKIDTLQKLDEVIEATKQKLNQVDIEVGNLIDDVDMRIDEIATKIENGELLIDVNIERLDSKVDAKTREIDNAIAEFEKTIQGRVDGIEETVNYQLVKNTLLTPVNIGETSNIGFVTNPIEVNAQMLVRSAYDFHASGCASSQSIIQSATGHIVFYQEVIGTKPVIKARMSVILDPAIQGKQLVPSVCFEKGGLIVDSLDITDVGYKIMIKAGIHINNINTAECYMTPLSRNILK